MIRRAVAQVTPRVVASSVATGVEGAIAAEIRAAANAEANVRAPVLLQARWLSGTSTARIAEHDGPQEKIDFGFTQVPKEEKVHRVAEVFHNVAPSYDIMNDLMSAGMHRLWKDRLVEKLRPFAGIQHLDVAGGTGDVAFRVHRAIKATEAAGPNPDKGHVTVSDINASMLEEGRARAQKMNIPEEDMSWVEGNAEKLPFSDESMDSYTIAFGIRNVTDKDAALRDAYRVLRKGGRLLVMEFSPVNTPGLQQLYDAYSFNIIPALGHFVAHDRESYQYLVESIRQFPVQERFGAMMRDAGFKNVDHEDLTGGIVTIHSGFKL